MGKRAWYRGVVAVTAAAGLLLTAACGDDEDDPLSQGGEDTIQWYDIQPADGDLGLVFAAFAEEFGEQDGGAPVELTSLQNGDPYNGALTTAMQSNDPPDLFQNWGGDELRRYVEADLVTDLTEPLADVIETIDPLALEPYTIDGRVYGLPYNSGMVGFWYNTELFEEAGISAPPATWTEFLDVVQQLKEADITPIALGNAALWPGHFWWAYLAMRIGGLDAFNQAVETQELTSPAFVEAGERLEELMALEPFQEGYIAINYEESDGQAATMGNGLAAMELMGQWAPGAQLDHAGITEEADRAAVLENRSLFPFPAVEGGAGTATEIFGGGDGLVVGANAPEETFEFLRFIFTNYDRISALPGTAPTVVEYQTQVSNPALEPVMETIATATGIQHYLDRAWPAPVGQAVNQGVGALLAGDSSPEDVVSGVNEAWSREQ